MGAIFKYKNLFISKIICTFVEIIIKRVIHCSDLHIRNYQRHEEYRVQMQKFIDECKNISNEYEFGEVAILIAGDVFHQKIQSSNEQTDLFAWFIKELDKICLVRIICGNHDFLENNKIFSNTENKN